MPEVRTLGRKPILAISVLCGVGAAAFEGWWLYTVFGWTIWFFILVFPACLATLQVVAVTVATALHQQYGDPNEDLLPRFESSSSQ